MEPSNRCRLRAFEGARSACSSLPVRVSCLWGACWLGPRRRPRQYLPRSEPGRSPGSGPWSWRRRGSVDSRFRSLSVRDVNDETTGVTTLRTMNEMLTGVIPVAPTVFDEAENLDLEGQARIVDYLVSA